ncbi:MAG: septation protein IspZ [candidate division FCPU426 bacterium]
MNPFLLVSQLLPLIVFIVVDSLVKDVRVSILAAVLFAAGQLVYTYLKVQQFDWFVVLDVGLIVALGAVSIIFKNDLFFKIKPAIIEGVTIIFMLALILAKDGFLAGYFGRMLPGGMALRPEAIGLMKTMLGWMCVYVLLHIGAVLYTAFYSSRKVWALVSGPGFYLIFIPIMAIVVARAIKARARTGSKQTPSQPTPGEKQAVGDKDLLLSANRTAGKN